MMKKIFKFVTEFIVFLWAIVGLGMVGHMLSILFMFGWNLIPV